MAKWTVVFEPDEGDWWTVSIPALAGVRTQAKSIEQGEKRIREALALAIGDKDADLATFVNDIRVAQRTQRLLEEVAKARRVANAAEIKQRILLVKALRALKRDGFSRRDSGALVGISHQRVQQLLEEESGTK